jgi:hypothetical protein
MEKGVTMNVSVKQSHAMHRPVAREKEKKAISHSVSFGDEPSRAEQKIKVVQVYSSVETKVQT